MFVPTWHSGVKHNILRESRLGAANARRFPVHAIEGGTALWAKARSWRKAERVLVLAIFLHKGPRFFAWPSHSSPLFSSSWFPHRFTIRPDKAFSASSYVLPRSLSAPTPLHIPLHATYIFFVSPKPPMIMEVEFDWRSHDSHLLQANQPSN